MADFDKKVKDNGLGGASARNSLVNTQQTSRSYKVIWRMPYSNENTPIDECVNSYASARSRVGTKKIVMVEDDNIDKTTASFNQE